MARRNRVSIPDGTYHITSRIVNREAWFKDPGFKDEIVDWMYRIADFSGVELLAWCIMDNHFHILVHVPEIPSRYRLNPNEPPASHAFGMRPVECNPALWSPTMLGASRSEESSLRIDEDKTVGDKAGEDSSKAVVNADGGISRYSNPRHLLDRASPTGDPTRPPTGFMLDDAEMLNRLGRLYGDAKRIDALRRTWIGMRERGNGAAVDAVKDRYCRRMYNLSQFVKTLKERIAQIVNKRTGHVGHVFEGRFYSGLVDGDRAVATTMALYIDYNPYKAGIVRKGETFCWSSFGVACGSGTYAAVCRAAYERLYGCKWSEAQRLVLESFAARLPPVNDLEGQMRSGKLRLSPEQLIHLRIPAFSRGAFIGRGVAFGRDCAARLAPHFPRPSFRSLEWIEKVVEWHIRAA